ncbi:MAG: STAS domain-containing protein [Micromonospora sp.]
MGHPTPHTTSAAQLRITPVPVGADRVRVDVAGEVDLATSGELGEALADVLDGRTGTTVEVDFAGVRFMDSSGILVLLRAHTRAAEQGCPLVLTNASRTVRRVLEITGVHAVLGVPAARG